MAVKNVDDLIKLAIAQEVKAQQFYTQALKKVTDEKIKYFLSLLIEEEKKHESVLNSLREEEIYDGSISVESYAELSKIIDAHTPNSFQWKSNMTLKEVFEIALEREHNAANFFEQLSRLPIHSEAQTLFKNLAKDEKNHHEQIGERYYALKGSLGKEG